MKSGLSGLILFATLLLVGCADKAEIQCEKRIEAGQQEGYNKAVADLQLENLRNLRGDQLACRLYSKLPLPLENLAGLDCSVQWPGGLENVSAAMRIAPAAILALIVFLGFGFFYFIVPGLGGFAGQALAAMALKIQPVRKQILGKVNQEEVDLRGQLEPLRAKIRALQDDAKVAAEKAAEAKESELLAYEALDALYEQADALRDELEKRIVMSKQAASTADLTNLLGQIGKKPSK
jgi:outer membrane murein-binding lipoprotein Lpp